MHVLGWVLFAFLALAGLCVLLLALLHVRYSAAWSGAWTGNFSFPHDGFLRLEFGFPGFMRAWEWPRQNAGPSQRSSRTPPSGESSAANPPTRPESIGARHAAPPAGSTSSVPHPEIVPAESPAEKDPNRWRKALFRLATDASAWGALFRYGLRVARLTHRLLRPRIELAAGHSDPALLGRMAGHWHAVSPLLPLGDTTMAFRFQDRHPSFRARVTGGFSGLSFLLFGLAAIGTFPFFTLGRRAWHGWKHREPGGWRAWAYRRIQSL